VFDFKWRWIAAIFQGVVRLCIVRVEILSLITSNIFIKHGIYLIRIHPLNSK